MKLIHTHKWGPWHDCDPNGEAFGYNLYRYCLECFKFEYGLRTGPRWEGHEFEDDYDGSKWIEAQKNPKKYVARD